VSTPARDREDRARFVGYDQSKLDAITLRCDPPRQDRVLCVFSYPQAYRGRKGLRAP